MVFKKGNISWNKNKKGLQIAWNKGVPCSNETKLKISEANRGRLIGDKNPTKRPEVRFKISQAKVGFHHSEESKKKMSIGHKGISAHNKGASSSIETRKKLSLVNIGKKLSEETKRKISVANKGENNGFYGKKHTADTRLKLSKSRVNKYKGKNNPMYGKVPAKGSGWGKGTYYQSPLQNKIWLRSSYELAYVQYLDSHKVLWFYELETFDLGNITYTPDFFLPRQEKFIEIKGYMRLKSKQQIQLFNEQYPFDLEVLGKNELLALGCII